jgi:methylated-DNA-protein-cysteine methyltransferase-like protein
MSGDASLTTFFDQVYELVSQIPRGKVATYGQIAKMLGAPRAARTVGWALHDLPEGRDIPWQRVVNAKGAVSFPPGSQGAAVQRALLEGEGVVFDGQGLINLKVFGWGGLNPVEVLYLFDPNG